MKIREISADKKEQSQLAEQIYQLLNGVYERSPWSLDFILADMASPQSRYYVAEMAKELVGFLATTEVMDELEITNIAVKSDFQGQHIASRLLERLPFEWDFTQQKENDSQDDAIHSVFLEVRASNLPAQRLYEKFGFEAYHVRKAYYSAPVEDAILMRHL